MAPRPSLSSLPSDGESHLSSGNSNSSGNFSPTTSLTAEGVITPTTPSSPIGRHLQALEAGPTTIAGISSIGVSGPVGGGIGVTAGVGTTNAASSVFPRALATPSHTFSDDPFFFGLFEKLPLVLDIGDAIVKAGFGGEPEPACLLRMRQRRHQLSHSPPETTTSHSSSANGRDDVTNRNSSHIPSNTTSSNPSSSSSNSGDSSSSNSSNSSSSSSSSSGSSNSLGSSSGNGALTARKERMYVRTVLDAEAESPYINAEDALVTAESSSTTSIPVGAPSSYLLYSTAETSFRITRRRIQRLLHYVIFKGLRVSPRERKVIICEALLHAEYEKHALVDVLFRDYDVETLSQEQLENCKIQCCYVRYNLRPQQEGEKKQEVHEREKQDQEGDQQQEKEKNGGRGRSVVDFHSDKDIFFRAAADKLLCINADMRSLTRCPRETRSLVAQNILLCGGSIQLRGMTTRIAVELDCLLAAARDGGLQRLRPLVKFGVPAYAPLLRAWTGASMHAALDGRAEYTREEFQKKVPLGDWTTWALKPQAEYDSEEETAAGKETGSSGCQSSRSNNKKPLPQATVATAREAGGAVGEVDAGGDKDASEQQGEEETTRSFYVAADYAYECGVD